MQVIVVLGILMVFLYKWADELQDESVNSSWRKPFLGLPLSFLNKRTGWLSKWETQQTDRGERPKPATKADKARYLWLYTPRHKERFPYSSTMMVFLTDGEHLFQLVKDILVGLSVALFTQDPLLGLYAFSATLLTGLVKEVLKKTGSGIE